MSVADDINGLAELCGAAAHQGLSAMIALGPRPADPAGQAWDATRTRLQGHMDRLSALATELASDAVLAALADQAAAVAQLGGVTDKAEAAIKQIQDASNFLALAAKVVDVAVAVLAVASTPSVASVQALGDAIKTLAAAAP